MKNFQWLGIIAMFLSLSLISSSNAAEWTHYANSSAGQHYFDPTSITFTGKNQAKVWVKRLWSKRDIEEAKELSGHIVKESKTLYGLDCRGKQRKMLHLIVYASDGTPISDHASNNPWGPIVPDSTEDKLLDRVCSKR
ncbi:MAG: hypothetical protein NT010_12965 [Proteobacteria bacterium]|nr:hypothetical protein [Pseudomonadota bacterium]